MFFFNGELNKIDTWLCANKLSLNVSKSSYTVFSNNDFTGHKSILIRNSKLNFVNSTKFLGITIDNKLDFSLHIQTFCNKLSKTIGIIRKLLSSFLPNSIIKQLYLSLVYPHLSYGVEVWGNFSKSKLIRINKLQYKCIKLIGNYRNMNHFLSNKLLCFDDVYKYYTLIRFYKYFVLEHEYHFKNKFLQYSISHQYSTRGRKNNNFNVPFVRVSRMYNSFLNNSLILWNQLPTSLRAIPNLSNFKIKFRNSFLACY